MLQWLVKLRGQRTQAEVADAVGVSQQQYSHIENGRRLPSVKTAKRIASFLGFSWVKFFSDDETFVE